MSDAVVQKRESTFDRRDEIARAARALIVEKGVEGLRTRDIAERVGINIATLHYHVPTKEALIALVADSLRRDFVQQSIDRPRAHMSAEERMEHEFLDFKEHALVRPEVMLVFSELIERARRDDVIAAAILPMKRHWRELIVQLLTEGVRAGVYRPDIDPEAFAGVLMATFIGFCRNTHKTPDALDRLVAELRRAMRNPALPAGTLSNSTALPRHSGSPTNKE
jgi:AcrR family transcriptional regulator